MKYSNQEIELKENKYHLKQLFTSNNSRSITDSVIANIWFWISLSLEHIFAPNFLKSET